MTHQQHHPDPEFVARLETQLTEEYRRRERLGSNHRPQRDIGRWLRGAGFTLVGLLLGAATVTTAQRIEDAGRLDLLLRQAEASASIAARRVDLNSRIAELATERMNAGVAPVTEIYPAQAELLEAELQLALAEHEIEEITASGRAVRSEISAPTVGGHDFVGERLQLELDANSRRMVLLEPIVEIFEARRQAGIPVSDEHSARMLERDQLAAMDSRLRDSLRLRQMFVAGDVDAEEAELRQRLLLVTARRLDAESRLDDVRAAHERLRQQIAVGISLASEAFASERELLQAEAEVEMARIEMDLIAAELGQ